MSRFGRRTFLASSTGLAAGAAVAGALPPGAAVADGEDADTPVAERGCAAGRAGWHAASRRRSRSTASSTLSASIPTTARSPGPCRHRAAPWRQTASRIVVRRTDPTQRRAGLGQRHGAASARQAFVGLRRAVPRRRRGVRVDGAAAWPGAAAGGPSRPRPGSPPRCAAPTGRPSGCARRRFAAARPRHLPAHRGHAAGGHRRAAPPPTSPPPTRTGCIVDGTAVDAWPSFSYPDEQYARAVDLTGARRRRATQRHRRAAPLVRARPGPPGVRAGPALPAVPAVRRRAPRRVRVRRQLAGAPGRMAPVTAAQPRRRRLRRVGRRAGPSAGLVRVPATTTARGRRSPSSARPAPRPFTPTYAQRTTIREIARPPRAACTRWPAVRSWPTSGPSIRRGRRWQFARGQPGAPSPCGRATCSIPTGRSRRCTARRRPTSPSPTSCGRAAQAFEAFTYFGFRYLQIDNPGQALAPGPDRRHHPARRHARRRRRRRSRRTTGCSTRSGGSRRAPACIAARSSSSTPRPGRRASSSGTPPTSPRR